MNDIQTETPILPKQPVRKKCLKIGIIAFAVIGVTLTLLIAATFIWRKCNKGQVFKCNKEVLT